MHKWVVGSTTEPVKIQAEKHEKGRTKREKALTIAVMVLAGVVAAMGWYAYTKTSDEDACGSVDCIKQAAWILRSIEPEFDPCDNFYNFVCNPNGLGEELVPKDIEEPSYSDFLTMDSSEKNPLLIKVEEIYNACMNVVDAEMRFKEFLHNLKNWGLLRRADKNFDWRMFLYKARKYGLKFNMFFNLLVIREGLGVFLRIEPPYFSEEESDVIEIFNISLGRHSRNFETSLKQIASINDGMIMDMTINDLQGNFSVLSLETINHLSGHNFSNEDVVQLVNPSYFKQLTKQLYSESNMSRILQDYLTYELVRPLIKEYTETYYTWEDVESSRVKFCTSRATEMVPFVAELKYGTEIADMVSVAENIIQELTEMNEHNEWMSTDSIEILIVDDVMNADDDSTPILRTYLRGVNVYNYMHLFIDAHKLKQNCYYSFLNENIELTCLLYNADGIEVHDRKVVITAKSLRYTFHHKDGPVHLNYAGVGSKIGRELVTDFLKSANDSGTEEKIKCLLNQQADYYYIAHGVAEMEGEEMFTDLMGTLLAYKAYSRLDPPRRPLPGMEYTNTQLFWLAKFRQECDYSDNFSRNSVLPFVNIRNFTADFSCFEGRYMNPLSVPRCDLL